MKTTKKERNLKLWFLNGFFLAMNVVMLAIVILIATDSKILITTYQLTTRNEIVKHLINAIIVNSIILGVEMLFLVAHGKIKLKVRNSKVEANFDAEKEGNNER